jgi:hypothetical protein
VTAISTQGKVVEGRIRQVTLRLQSYGDRCSCETSRNVCDFQPKAPFTPALYAPARAFSPIFNGFPSGCQAADHHPCGG